MTSYGNSTIWTGRKAAPKLSTFKPFYAVGEAFSEIHSLTRLTHNMFRGAVTVCDDPGTEYKVVLYQEHIQAIAFAAGLDALPSVAGSTLVLETPVEVKLRRWDDKRQQYNGIAAIRDESNAVMYRLSDWQERIKQASEPIVRDEPQPVTLDTLRETCYTFGFMQEMTCSIRYVPLSHKIAIYCKPMTADDHQRYIDTLGAHMDKYDIEIIAQVKKPRFMGGF